MSHNGQDKSGNALKYSLIPLMIGIAVIFFVHRSCESAVFVPTPLKGTPAVIVDEELSPEQPLVKVDTTSTATVVDLPAEIVAKDTLQAAK